MEFTVKNADGSIVGKYTAGKDGTVTVTVLIPGSTVVVVETKVPSGYVLDSTSQTIVVKNGSNTLAGGTVTTLGGTTGGNTNTGSIGNGTNTGNNLDFENDPIGTFELIKVDAADKTRRLSGVTFEIRKMDDALVETVTTGSDGRVSLKLDRTPECRFPVLAFFMSSSAHLEPRFWGCRSNRITPCTTTA